MEIPILPEAKIEAAISLFERFGRDYEAAALKMKLVDVLESAFGDVRAARLAALAAALDGTRPAHG